MRWTEHIMIDRPKDVVYAAIADEHQLMLWSAWPAATGFTCKVDGDGTSLGSEIVFTDRKGVEQGRQRLAATEPGQVVTYRLTNRGPRGRTMHPQVVFRLDPVAPTSTRVHLDFQADIPLPAPLRQLASAVVGRRVRKLHIEDLRLLKSHVEQ